MNQIHDMGWWDEKEKRYGPGYAAHQAAQLGAGNPVALSGPPVPSANAYALTLEKAEDILDQEEGSWRTRPPAWMKQ
jgi:hypothetical protein